MRRQSKRGFDILWVHSGGKPRAIDVLSDDSVKPGTWPGRETGVIGPSSLYEVEPFGEVALVTHEEQAPVMQCKFGSLLRFIHFSSVRDSYTTAADQYHRNPIIG